MSMKEIRRRALSKLCAGRGTEFVFRMHAKVRARDNYRLMLEAVRSEIGRSYFPNGGE